MLFTRTIRRTMVCGLAMVLCMMIGLLLSAVYSHFSYKTIIRRLDSAFNDCPQRSELVDALCTIQKPLLIGGLRKTPDVLEFQRREFLKALEGAQAVTDGFIRSLDLLPPDPELDQPSKLAKDLAVEIALRLSNFRKHSADLNDAARHDAVVRDFRDQVDVLQNLAQTIPDFQRGIPETLDDARILFRRGFWLVVGSGIIAVVFFSGLIVYGYLWVFAPLRRLHQGARRVAQGDFNYRLELSRQDEMKELADAFNSMTSRFQEIRGDLDRQVCERIKQLIRSERLAGIGFLAAGVAHEINNPLSAIAMAAESLTDRYGEQAGGTGNKDAEIVRKYLDLIQREAFRCQKITQKLLDFARGESDICVRHDLTVIVNDVLGVIRHLSRYNDRTIRFRRTHPCWLEINGPEIQQVVMNLVANGLEAMDTNGTMTIDITEQTDYVTLTVQDDGCGMSPRVIENLFEPFFTERRNGRGTGLGLSISHRIVSDHGGTIEVESPGPGRGSTFRVRLPRRAVKREAA